MTDDSDLQTTVDGEYHIQLPESLRAELQLKPGDTIQWDITDDDRLLGTVVTDDTND